MDEIFNGLAKIVVSVVLTCAAVACAVGYGIGYLIFK